MFSKFLEAARSIVSIKKTEIVLPIARYAAYVTPLLVGDDLALRTSVVSPVKYDREITNVLFRHTEIVGPEGEPLKLNYESYISKLSNIDKICSIWGLYKVTYETLGVRRIKCPAENCGEELEYEILFDDLIHEKSDDFPEDTFTPWDEDVPFYDYVYPITIEYNDFVYEFDTWLPTIKHNNRILSNLSIDVIQKNLSSIGYPYTRAEQMALLTKTIRLRPKNSTNAEDILQTSSVQEIIVAFNSYIPLLVGERFFREYTKRFGKYVPKFYAMLNCKACGHRFRYDVDIEYELFRRYISGGGESGEEL